MKDWLCYNLGICWHQYDPSISHALHRIEREIRFMSENANAANAKLDALGTDLTAIADEIASIKQALIESQTAAGMTGDEETALLARLDAVEGTARAMVDTPTV